MNSDLVREGRESRIPLHRWQQIVEEHRSDAISEFLLRMLKREILSPRLAVAAGRFDGGVQRLQLTIEEEGIVSLSDRSFVPWPTKDRLAAALSLASECGLVSANRDDRFALA